MDNIKSRRLRIFKNTMSMAQFIFSGKGPDGKDTGIGGKSAPFIAGEYRTDHEAEIAELEREIKNKHPHIYVDPAHYDMDAEDVDPTVALKKKHFAEFEALQKAAMNKGNTGKTSGEGGEGTGMSTSASTGAGAANSNTGANPGSTPGGGMGAKLAGLAGLGKK